MLQHRPLKNSKQIKMIIKCSVKKNVIYWLNHIGIQIQEIFPSKLAHPINKRVLCTRLFIGFTILSENIFCIWKSMWINLYIFHSWLPHSWNIFFFFTSLDDIKVIYVFMTKIWISPISIFVTSVSNFLCDWLLIVWTVAFGQTISPV